jgi:c-di-GMP-binding flagellar brake protein YcgR
MNTSKDINEHISLIQLAIQEEINISVSLKTKHKSSICHSRFLNVDKETIIFEGSDSKVIDPYDPIQEVSITFNNDYIIYSFTTDFIGEQSYTLDNGNTVMGLKIRLPENINETDRRNSKRIYVEENTNLGVSFWVDDDIRCRFFGRLHNISLDGIGIVVEISDKIILFNNMRCNIGIYSSDGNELLILPVRYRYRKRMKDEKYTFLGFQYEISNYKRDDSMKLGVLNQIITHLQSSSRLNLSLA